MSDREHDYLERTIATVRNHRDADNCWPQWANIFADEIERLWGVCTELEQAEANRDQWHSATNEAAEERDDWRRRCEAELDKVAALDLEMVKAGRLAEAVGVYVSGTNAPGDFEELRQALADYEEQG